MPMRCVSLAGLLLAGCSTVQAPPPAAAVPSAVIAAPTPDEANAAFEKLGTAYIDIVTAMDPVAATQMGDHEHDGELPGIDPTARTRRIMMDRELLQALEAIDPALLTRENQVDYALLKNAVEYDLWDVETLQTWAWNPQYYNDIASYALYSLVARDFAPWPQRFGHIVERMEKLPAFLAQARAQLDPARVPKVHAETVARQNAGIMEIVDAALLPEVEQSGVDRTRFDAALSNLKTAVAEHQKWLDDVLVPNARGEFRLGAELYDTKMRFALMSPMTRPQLKARAEAAFTEARSEMERLARTFPDCAGGSQQQAI